jgi:hypothetical protein
MIVKQHHSLRRARLRWDGYNDVLPGELGTVSPFFGLQIWGEHINSPYLLLDLLKLLAIDLVPNPT